MAYFDAPVNRYSFLLFGIGWLVTSIILNLLKYLLDK